MILAFSNKNASLFDKGFIVEFAVFALIYHLMVCAVTGNPKKERQTHYAGVLFALRDILEFKVQSHCINVIFCSRSTQSCL